MSEKIFTALGDSHGGKSVELVIDGEEKYLLKPKSADIQSAFEAFLAELSREGFPFVPECEKIIEKGKDYYKTVFVENTPAGSLSDVSEYFKKCGSLIFIAYMLSSADLHSENIIARKNSPVLIDVENIISGNIARPVNTGWKNLAGSVADSSLLPHWTFNGEEKIQCGGICSDDINSPSTLKYKNSVMHIYDHKNELITGFKSAYGFALKNKKFITEQLDFFADCKFRILLRQTEIYAKIIRCIEKTENNEKQTLAVKLLERAYKKDFRKDRLKVMRKVCDCEIKSVLNGDIPYFYVEGNGIDLCGDGKVLAENFFSASPLENAKQKINSLSETDLEAQMKIIVQSLSSLMPVSLKEHIISNSDDVIEIIYNKLENACIPDLSAGWLMLERASDRMYVKSVDNGLYSGLTGILCAYASFYYKTQNKKYLCSLLNRYKPFSEYVKNRTVPLSLKSVASSLQSGTGGIINSLFHIYELTGEEIFRNDAVKIASLISLDTEADGGDVLGGTAGLALCLIKLPKELALPIAEKLIMPLSEFSPELTGMAHGLAGVSLSLAVLQNILGISSFDSRILELLKKENSYYFTEHNNWRDLRSTGGLNFMNGWCAGAPGIGMARKKLLQLTENEEIAKICKSDIEKVINNLSGDAFLKRDGLCCGNSSRLSACSALGIKNDKLFNLLCEKVKTDTLNFDNINGSCVEDYSLMQGLAGVGYALSMYNDEKCGGMLL